MKYIELDRDPLDGLPPDRAELLLERVRDKSGDRGNLYVTGADREGNLYYLIVEDPDQLAVITTWLEARNIAHRVGEMQETPAMAAAETVIPKYGVIFLLISKRQFPVPAARGAISAIAASIADWNREPVLRAGIRDADDSYWVGFNLLGGGQALAALLHQKGVAYEYAEELPGGGPPELKLVDITPPAPEEPQPARRSQPRAARETPTEGQGFAEMRAMFGRLGRARLMPTLDRQMGRLRRRRREPEGD